MLRFLRITMLWVVMLPYLFFGIGFVSNKFVLIANHDKFPVMLNEKARAQFKPDVNGIIDDYHCVMTSDTHLNVLGDIFNLHGVRYSIGDFILMLSDWLGQFCIFVWMALVVKSMHQKAMTHE